MLDFLIGRETNFLAYLLFYLKFLISDWDNFCILLKSQPPHQWDNLLSTIIRLKYAVDRLVRRDLFPYNPEPLIEKMKIIEDFYEKTGIHLASNTSDNALDDVILHFGEWKIEGLSESGDDVRFTNSLDVRLT